MFNKNNLHKRDNENEYYWNCVEKKVLHFEELLKK